MRFAKLAAWSVLACAAVLMLSVAAEAAPLFPHATTLVDVGGLSGMVATAAAGVSINLDALRAVHGDLVSRAAATMKEAKDGMPAAELAAIEQRHAALVDQATAMQGAIDAASRAAPVAAVVPAVDATTTGGDVKADRERTAEIANLAQRHAMPDLLDHIGKGTSLDAVRKIVLDKVAEGAAGKRLNGRSPANGAEVVQAAASWDRALTRAGATL
jgi:hypothetical protein